MQINGRVNPPADPDTMREAVAYAISSRRSIRGFTATQIDRATITRLLEIASRAPSGSNIQPWKAHVLMGAPLARVSAALLGAFTSGEAESREYQYYPRIWRSPYLERRRDLGWKLYALAGVARGDKAAGKRQTARNYAFFGAPVGLIFTIDRDMEQGSWLDYGMFLQSLMIAARGFGLDTCPQAAIANYPDVLRKELGLPDSGMVVCGMALGVADPAEPTNGLVAEREPVSAFTIFHGDQDAAG
ncbi:nitroreductase [Roseomonas xinghualingensis]|uniref:nitroreductase n=1 Tax=Roseomonas xinghualingensis TaxID=2986475 RepID=UPI0021F1A8EA|nr:nitroreductase [Roseomonas sp. SXEYE001]MCV4207605.1 nitroreductase [Roseomonas sp. SXEYE001]